MAHRTALTALFLPLVLALTTACATTGATDRTAGQLVQDLARQMPTATASVVYDATTDPNHLLGRPGGYTSKATFTDSRIDPEDTAGAPRGAVELGGSIEVFPAQEGAEARKAYIDGNAKLLPGLAEYSWVHGSALLRVSRLLTPGQAAEYERAFETS